MKTKGENIKTSLKYGSVSEYHVETPIGLPENSTYYYSIT